MYPKGLEIQRLADNQVKFSFEEVQLRRVQGKLVDLPQSARHSKVNR